MEKIIKKQQGAEGPFGCFRMCMPSKRGSTQAEGDDVKVLSQVHVFRVYPKSEKKGFTNRNYDPHLFWRAGCQIVALNLQEYDDKIWVNAGKFRANHGIGYVPKPTVERYLPELRKRCKIGINIRVDDLQADESVIISVHGQVGPNGWESQTPTKQVFKKGRVALLNRKEWVLTDPEHAVILIVARKGKIKQLVGQYAFPASEIKGGACTVSLLDKKGLPLTKQQKRLRLFVDHEDLNNNNGTTAPPNDDTFMDTNKYFAGVLPFKPPTKTPHTTAGLASYWINSSHNSYLQGGMVSNQITSSPSPQMLTQLVRTGCRVIELDCYNNSQPGDGAYVKHKLCPTISLDFSACIEAIKAGIKLEKDDREKPHLKGLQVKQGPLIITLENHATGKTYKQMGITMREVFGDLLHLPGDNKSQAHALLKIQNDITHLCDKVIVRVKPNDSKQHPENPMEAFPHPPLAAQTAPSKTANGNKKGFVGQQHTGAI